MSDPSNTSVSTRPREAIPGYLPRWGFFKGFLTGAVIEIPSLACAVWVLARLGIGNQDVGFMRIMRLTTVFAGIAAVFTAAGIGRLAAYASMQGGRRRALWVCARAHAVASAGLVIIAAVPLGHLPTVPWHWIVFPSAGVVAGALCGVMIGTICSGTAPVNAVWWLAKRPTEALRYLLAPEELMRLGAAAADRTSHLFDGMFDPAPLPPGTKAEPEPKIETKPEPKIDTTPETKVEPKPPEPAPPT
jgi:hypothetical protein